MSAIVVYHDNCADGFGAAFAAWMKLEDNAEYIACNYGAKQEQFIQEMAAKGWQPVTLYIVDFAFKLHQLNELAKCFEKIVVLDHHKTARDDLQELYATDDAFPENKKWIRHTDLVDNIEVIFDMSRSGAQIAWDYFHTYYKSDGRPELIDFIGMRDLWKHKGTPHEEDAEAVHLALTSAPFNCRDWFRYVNPSGFVLLLNKGHAIRNFFQQRVEEICKPEKILKTTYASYNLKVINAPYYFASEVGDFLREDGWITLVWSYDTRDVVVSLRSAANVDCSQFAKLFGGGGHAQAAGFKLPWCTFVELFLTKATA
jgi:uncharacterized protein